MASFTSNYVVIRTCLHCFKTSEEMKSCAKCGIAYYCSVECYILESNCHKYFCLSNRLENKNNLKYITSLMKPCLINFFLAYIYHIYIQTGDDIGIFTLIMYKNSIVVNHQPTDMGCIYRHLITNTHRYVNKEILSLVCYIYLAGTEHYDISIISPIENVIKIYNMIYRRHFTTNNRWVVVRDILSGKYSAKFVDNSGVFIKVIELINDF